MQTLSQQVGDAAGLLGLLLALNTLFTAEQARRLEDERGREGGARKGAVSATRWLTAALAAITAASLVMLSPLVADIADTVGDDDWEPVLGVFVLTWVLLVGLFAWQVVITARTWKTPT